MVVEVAVKSVNFSEDVLMALAQHSKGNLSAFLNQFLREHLISRKKSSLGSLKGLDINPAEIKEKKDRVDNW